VDAAAFCVRRDCRAGVEPVSDLQHADERCCCVRRSRVVLTSRRWCQVGGVKSAQPGLDKTYPLMRVAIEPVHPGEHEVNRKTIACGNVGRFRCTRLLVCFYPHLSAREAAGAAGTRRSPRPLWAEDFMQISGASRREIASAYLRLDTALVPRMLRSAPPFAAWCAAKPGPMIVQHSWVPALRSSVTGRRCASPGERCTASGTREVRFGLGLRSLQHLSNAAGER